MFRYQTSKHFRQYLIIIIAYPRNAMSGRVRRGKFTPIFSGVAKSCSTIRTMFNLSVTFHLGVLALQVF